MNGSPEAQPDLVLLTKAELAQALAGATAERRAAIAGRVADVFSVSAADASWPRLLLFDDLFMILIEQLDRDARARLAQRIAVMTTVPPATVRRFALDDLSDVACPILQSCMGIGDDVLLEAAQSKGPGHLLAISRRRRLEMPVTDVLVERGDRTVVLTLASNPGARFSDFGFGTLVDRCRGDDELAATVGLRVEIPRRHFIKLLSLASEVVRRRLESQDPIGADAIRAAVSEAAAIAKAKAAVIPRDYAAATNEIETLRLQGQLTEATLADLARQRNFEKCVVALSCLSDTPIARIEAAMLADRPEPVLILARAIGASWDTAKDLLRVRPGYRLPSESELHQCMATYFRLRTETARQVLVFQQRRAASG